MLVCENATSLKHVDAPLRNGAWYAFTWYRNKVNQSLCIDSHAILAISHRDDYACSAYKHVAQGFRSFMKARQRNVSMRKTTLSEQQRWLCERCREHSTAHAREHEEPSDRRVLDGLSEKMCLVARHTFKYDRNKETMLTPSEYSVPWEICSDGVSYIGISLSTIGIHHSKHKYTEMICPNGSAVVIE